MGSEVRIAAVAISQGGVTIRVGTEYDVSQPAILSKTGETQVVPKTTVEVKEKKAESVILPDGATVDEVVRGLRALGVSARDIISILQAIKIRRCDERRSGNAVKIYVYFSHRKFS